MFLRINLLKTPSEEQLHWWPPLFLAHIQYWRPDGHHRSGLHDCRDDSNNHLVDCPTPACVAHSLNFPTGETSEMGRLGSIPRRLVGMYLALLLILCCYVIKLLILQRLHHFFLVSFLTGFLLFFGRVPTMTGKMPVILTRLLPYQIHLWLEIIYNLAPQWRLHHSSLLPCLPLVPLIECLMNSHPPLLRLFLLYGQVPKWWLSLIPKKIPLHPLLAFLRHTFSIFGQVSRSGAY